MSEDEKPQERNLRKISKEELNEILKAHAKWVEEGCDEKKPGRANLSWHDLSGFDLVGANLQKAWLENANLRKAVLENANLQEARLGNANLQKALLFKSDLQEAVLDYANLQKAAFDNANLQRASLLHANLQKAWLKNANLQEAELRNADLQGARLKMAQLFRARLMHANLQEAFLFKANLKEAWLYNTNLKRAKLNNSYLREATFERAKLQGADLTQADFSDASLVEAKLQGAILRHTNLGGALHLDLRELAGMDLYTTILPSEVAKFEGLKTVDEAAKKGSHLFTTLLLGCLFAWLSVGFGVIAPKDGGYNVQSLTLNESGFLLLAPAFILALFFYFQMYLQRLWEQLALMPAIFPDGSPLDKKAHPWLPIGYVRAHVKVLRENRPPLSKLQTVLIQLTVYWSTPLTISLFWWSYLEKRYWPETVFHSALTLASVWIAAVFLQQARLTLRREEDPVKKSRAQGVWTPDRIFDGLSMPGLLAVFITLIVLGLGWAKYFS